MQTQYLVLAKMCDVIFVQPFYKDLFIKQNAKVLQKNKHMLKKESNLFSHFVGICPQFKFISCFHSWCTLCRKNKAINSIEVNSFKRKKR